AVRLPASCNVGLPSKKPALAVADSAEKCPANQGGASQWVWSVLARTFETLGGFGSGMAMDLDSWRKNRDGSYSGTLYMLPDRGWSTQGTTHFRGRLPRFAVTLKPFYGTSTTYQNQLKLDYRQSTLFHQWGGTPTAGLDPTGVRLRIFNIPSPCRAETDSVSALRLHADSVAWM